VVGNKERIGSIYHILGAGRGSVSAGGAQAATGPWLGVVRGKTDDDRWSSSAASKGYDEQQEQPGSRRLFFFSFVLRSVLAGIPGRERALGSGRGVA
jgi:hypothetical protein